MTSTQNREKNIFLFQSRSERNNTSRRINWTYIMRDYSFHLVILIVLAGAIANNLYAQNPIIRDQFTADPSARVFGDSVYLFPSHDIPPGNGRGRAGWFCMEDYHVFSSANLTDWTDHGVIVSQNTVPWVNSKSYALWAPDCIYRNGKYFFYFPAPVNDTTYWKRVFSRSRTIR